MIIILFNKVAVNIYNSKKTYDGFGGDSEAFNVASV